MPRRLAVMSRATASVPGLTAMRCGVLDGWRDPWDGPDDSAALRAQAEAAERRQMARAEVVGQRWQGELLKEQWRGDRARQHRA